MLQPNSTKEVLQKIPLSKLISLYRVQPRKVLAVIRGGFKLKCKCNYLAYTPFPTSCPKCKRSYNPELQQFHQLTTAIMGMVTSGASKKEGSKSARDIIPAKKFCSKCGRDRLPGDRFCDKCGHPY